MNNKFLIIFFYLFIINLSEKQTGFKIQTN